MTARSRLTVLLPALLALGACSRQRSESYGFVATLGNDTTSVERVTRTGNRVVSDAVGRSPAVVRRHWEATLGPDGSVRHWTMDTYIPNAPPGQRELHHVADFTGDAIRLFTRGRGDSTRVAYARRYVVTVPWNAFVYGTWELMLDAARGRPDTTHIGQYFFEGWDQGHIGSGRVRRLDDGGYSVSSTGLSGTGVARLDSAGRLLSYSGEGTTYKQEVRRVADPPDVEAIAARLVAEEKAAGMQRALSPRDTVQATLGGTAVTVDYSRPAMRGRTLLGGLIPYDRVWRTGANAATQLIVSGPVRLAGVDLDAGTYTLWTLPTQQGVQLIINAQAGQWGTQYGRAHDIARRPMRVDTLASPVERFTIRVEPDTAVAASGATGQAATPVGPGASAGRLVMEWGRFRWSAPIVASDSRIRTRG